MKNKITVLVYDTGKAPEIREVEDGLDSMQELVGGMIETVPISNVFPRISGDVSLVCNEEGKINGLPANRDLGFDVICGDFLFTRGDENGETVSLLPEDIARILETIP